MFSKAKRCLYRPISAQGAPLFCLLAVATITIYFQNAQNKSLSRVIDTLKVDFQREHHERVVRCSDENIPRNSMRKR